MHEKLSQAVRLYDELLSAQVAHPSRRNIATTSPPYSSSSRQAVADSWVSPQVTSSPEWTRVQAQPPPPTQMPPLSPRVPHTTPVSTAHVSHLTGHHPTSLPYQPGQVMDSSVLQTVPKQGSTQLTMTLHPSPSVPQQGANPSSNFRTLSPRLQGAMNTQSQLPNFPTVPTLAPQSSYMPSVPQSAIQQPDRQEALLIDL